MNATPALGKTQPSKRRAILGVGPQAGRRERPGPPSPGLARPSPGHPYPVSTGLTGTAGARQGQFRPTLTVNNREVNIARLFTPLGVELPLQLARSPRSRMATWTCWRAAWPARCTSPGQQHLTAAPITPFGRGPGSQHGSKITAPNWADLARRL
jgi:hypothetical protein